VSRRHVHIWHSHLPQHTAPCAISVTYNVCCPYLHDCFIFVGVGGGGFHSTLCPLPFLSITVGLRKRERGLIGTQQTLRTAYRTRLHGLDFVLHTCVCSTVHYSAVQAERCTLPTWPV
jgi:hypothetical protein